MKTTIKSYKTWQEAQLDATKLRKANWVVEIEQGLTSKKIQIKANIGSGREAKYSKEDMLKVIEA